MLIASIQGSTYASLRPPTFYLLGIGEVSALLPNAQLILLRPAPTVLGHDKRTLL